MTCAGTHMCTSDVQIIFLKNPTAFWTLTKWLAQFLQICHTLSRWIRLRGLTSSPNHCTERAIDWLLRLSNKHVVLYALFCTQLHYHTTPPSLSVRSNLFSCDDAIVSRSSLNTELKCIVLLLCSVSVCACSRYGWSTGVVWPACCSWENSTWTLHTRQPCHCHCHCLSVSCLSRLSLSTTCWLLFSLVHIAQTQLSSTEFWRQWRRLSVVRMCAVHTSVFQFSSYSGNSDFEFFRPAGVTRCTNGKEI